MTDLKLTIGMPVYNSEEYLSESIDSLLGQTYGDFVLSISDNASTDATADICKDFARKDKRIHYHRNKENIGMTANFNLVAERCETPYFKWSTGDDYCAPTMLEKTLPVIEQDPTIALCYPKTVLVNSVENTERLYDDNLHLMQHEPADRFIAVMKNIGLCNVHYGISRTAALQRTSMLGPFLGSDINFIAELALYGKFFEVQENLFFRRFHEKASSWERQNTAHQIRYFHSATTKDIKLNRWRKHVGYFRAAYRAPTSLSRKLMVYLFLLRGVVGQRRALARELWDKVTGK